VSSLEKAIKYSGGEDTEDEYMRVTVVFSPKNLREEQAVNLIKKIDLRPLNYEKVLTKETKKSLFYEQGKVVLQLQYFLDAYSANHQRTYQRVKKDSEEMISHLETMLEPFDKD
jgi:hypothetical protein